MKKYVYTGILQGNGNPNGFWTMAYLGLLTNRIALHGHPHEQTCFTWDSPHGTKTGAVGPAAVLPQVLPALPGHPHEQTCFTWDSPYGTKTGPPAPFCSASGLPLVPFSGLIGPQNEPRWPKMASRWPKMASSSPR